MFATPDRAGVKDEALFGNGRRRKKSKGSPALSSKGEESRVASLRVAGKPAMRQAVSQFSRKAAGKLFEAANK